MPQSILLKITVLAGMAISSHAWDNVTRNDPNGVNLSNFPYPMQSSKGVFPSDWPTFGKCRSCPVNDDPANCKKNCLIANRSDPSCCNFAGQPFPNQWPDNNLTYPNFPGYGFFSWSAWAKSHEEGANGGNLWAMKWGDLPAGYSYDGNATITVSVLDTIRVYVEEGYSLHRFLDGEDSYKSCSFNNALNISATKPDMIPGRVAAFTIQNFTMPCLESWTCFGASITVRSTNANNDIQALNPDGVYGTTACLTSWDPAVCKKRWYSVDITFAPADAGSTFYFADPARCGSGMKAKIRVIPGTIHFLGQFYYHLERFPRNGYIQRVFTDGLALGPADEVWILVPTQSWALYRVFSRDKWEGKCQALANQNVLPTEAVPLDTHEERALYYPSTHAPANEPRHLSRLRAATHLKSQADEILIGVWNPFINCKGFNDVTRLPCVNDAGRCTRGPTSFGDRLAVRRAGAAAAASSSSPPPPAAAAPAAQAPAGASVPSSASPVVAPSAPQSAAGRPAAPVRAAAAAAALSGALACLVGPRL